tara:strand:+ start:668 stop:853 length:186 start_codon:yes stop_codon:yes gene_type:complete
MNEKKKRGSGNKNTQFEQAIMKDMQEQGFRGLMDSPGLSDRNLEEQRRKAYKDYTKRNLAK